MHLLAGIVRSYDSVQLAAFGLRKGYREAFIGLVAGLGQHRIDDAGSGNVAVDADACPAILYSNVEDWNLPDPKGKSIEEVRAIRDEIRARVEALLKE